MLWCNVWEMEKDLFPASSTGVLALLCWLPDLPVYMVRDCLDVNLVGACHAFFDHGWHQQLVPLVCWCLSPPHRAHLHRLSSTPPSPTLLTPSSPTWAGLPQFSDLEVLNMWHWRMLCFASPAHRHLPRPHVPASSTRFVYINWAYMVHAAA